MNRASALVGILVLAWMAAPPTFAGDASLGVRPFAGVAPNTIADLTVSSTSIEGQIQLKWTAPPVFAGSTLDSYQIRAATFSLADVGGSTNTWWNNASGILVQGLYGENPGQTATRTLGPPGSSHNVSLFPGATYYLAVRSADDVGIQFDFWSAINSTPYAVPFDSAPATPMGLAVAISSRSFTLTWNDLTPSGKGLDFSGYQLYRSTHSGSGFQLLAGVSTTTYTDTAVSVQVAYYYRITAIDLGAPSYPGGALESAPSPQISAQLVGTLAKPEKPNGMLTDLSNGQFSFVWHAVTRDTSQNPLAIDHYRIDRYTSIQSTPTATYTLAATATPSFSDPNDGQTYYYRIVAVSVSGATSDPSDYFDSTGFRYALAADDSSTRVVIPQSLEEELRLENNVYGEDIEIRLTHKSSEETDPILRSYSLDAYRVPSGLQIPRFAFSRPLISVQLGYGAIIGSPRYRGSSAAQSLRSANALSSEQLAQIISIYWNNGGGFIPLGNPTLSAINESVMVSVSNLGAYQIRARALTNAFKLSKGSPYPRLITPHDAAQNNRVFFFFDNPADEVVSGSIYDLRGAKVRDIQVDGLSPTPNSMVWDGRDARGNIVPTGIYLYRVTAGKEKATGTLVVAE
jgi:hypothetical protein